MRRGILNVKKAGEALLDIFFPRRCVFCMGEVESKSYRVCDKCQRTLPYTGKSGCEQQLHGMNGCYSPLYYKGNVRQSIHRYKFKGVYSYCETYAKIIAKCIDECEVSCDIISWVPVSALRYYSRGYDQAAKIAQELSRIKGIEAKQLLRKRRHNRAQSSIAKPEKRKANVSGVYCCIDPEAVKGKCILLVDDVVTTGSTLCSCTAVLKAAGAASVDAVTLARTPKGSGKSKTKDKSEHTFSLY